jgi:hypothetical protein
MGIKTDAFIFWNAIDTICLYSNFLYKLIMKQEVKTYSFAFVFKDDFQVIHNSGFYDVMLWIKELKLSSYLSKLNIECKKIIDLNFNDSMCLL